MWLLLAIAAVLVLVIAWFAITMVTTRLSETPHLAVFDIEAATTYVADNLPHEVAARLSHDDVRLLLRWEITYMRERGVASFGLVDETAEFAASRNLPMIADEDELVDELLFRARSEGLDADAIDIVCVTDLVADYLSAIGAIGEVVEPSELDGGDTEPRGELPQ